MAAQPGDVATVTVSGETGSGETVSGQTAPASPTPFGTNQLIADRFRVIRRIAEGGMGVVYEVRDEKLNERRALKCAKPGFASRLSPETRHSLRVTHPNVCRVFEIHSTGTPSGPVDFITMEFLDGGTLAAHLATVRPTRDEAQEIALQICAGVEAAHSQGLLHRDLKASNVMLARDARGTRRAVVTDFGLSQESSGTIGDGTPPGISGTLPYLAPERLEGAPATVASDIFALGILLHEIATGRRPAVTADGVRMYAPDLPRRWRQVIARCLHAEPSKRFATVADVAKALTGPDARTLAIRWSFAALVLGGVAVWQLTSPATVAARLAILPLDAPGADAETAALVAGLSSDLSTRLERLRPRPPQLIVIPLQTARPLAARDLNVIRETIGATHVLRGTIARRGERLVVQSAIVDTTSHVALREASADYAASDAGAVASALAAMTASAFKLPRQRAAETITPAAYAPYAEGHAGLQASPSAYLRTIAAFERAIELDPSSVLPRAGLAEACYQAWEATSDPRWLTRGREEIAKAEALNADSLALRLASGRLHLVPGQYARAIQDYQRAIELNETSPEAWRGLARAYQDLGDRDSDAAAAYARAIEMQPNYYAPLNNFGDFHLMRGNYGEAEKYFKQVVALVPQLLLGHSNLGGLYSQMGRYDEAQAELRRALEIDPTSRAVLNNLATVHQYQGQDAEAVALLERARAIGPETYLLFANLGDSYRRLTRTAEAEAAYRRGRELADELTIRNPRDAGSRAFVAYFSVRLGERASGERELVQALNLGSENRAVIRRAVIIYEALGDRSRAIDVLHSAPLDVVREMNRHPDTRQLRTDPRFVGLLSRVTP